VTVPQKPYAPNLLISVPIQYSRSILGLSVVRDIRPFRPTPSLLSVASEFVLLWQWDLCEPSMKRDPFSLPFFPLSTSFHHCYRRFLSRWAQMSGFPSPLLTCTTRFSRASCLPFPADLSFLVLIGSPIWLPSQWFFFFRAESRFPRSADWKKGGADIAASFNSRGTIDLLQCS